MGFEHEKYTHQFRTIGSENYPQALKVLQNKYGFYEYGMRGTWRNVNEKSLFTLIFMGADDFNITLKNIKEDFRPDPSRLEFQIIARALQVARVKGLRDNMHSREFTPEQFQQLLQCYCPRN